MNPIHQVKPGATTLLSGQGPQGEQVVLAYQRYGRGKAVAFPVVDSWTWQFHADLPLEDPTHETFWQQLLRWLVEGVPEIVRAETDRESVELEESVRILTELNDSSYVEVNDASVEATVTAPDGSTQILPLDWTVDRDGEYAGTFNPILDGDYEIRVEATRGSGQLLGTDVTHLRVGPSMDEYFDANLRRGLLERLAQETGGKFYEPETVGSLAEDIQFTGAGVTLTEERDLWDMPFLFLLLVAFVGSEWALRRRRGLV
jgi:hypothetical protein